MQHKGVTPVSTVLRAANGIVALCTVDVDVVCVWPTILLCILRKFTQSKHTFTTVPGSPAITGSFWMVADHKPAWSQL